MIQQVSQGEGRLWGCTGWAEIPRSCLPSVSVIRDLLVWPIWPEMRGTFMNTAANLSCVGTNKPQRQRQNIKTEKVFLGRKGFIWDLQPLLFFLSLWGNNFSLLVLTLYLFRHRVFSCFINAYLLSYWKKIWLLKQKCFHICFSPFFYSCSLLSMSCWSLPQQLFILNDWAQIPLLSHSLSRLWPMLLWAYVWHCTGGII